MARSFGPAAAAVLLAALLMETHPDGRVALKVLAQCPLPELCLWRLWLGRSCPTCGLTRSVIAAVHGRWAESIGFHVLGLPLTLAAGVLSVLWLGSIASRAGAALLAGRPAGASVPKDRGQTRSQHAGPVGPV